MFIQRWRNAKDLRDYLISQGWKEGLDIRLISCNTGKETDGIAQQLADLMKVTVTAPTEFIWIDKDGEITGIYAEGKNKRRDLSTPGHWEAFPPK